MSRLPVSRLPLPAQVSIGAVEPAADRNVALPDTPLNLTPEEKRVFGELFRQADTEQMGVVTGEVAVKFFERTKLPPQVLGEVR